MSEKRPHPPLVRLTFRQQLRLCLLIALVNILLAHLLHTGLFHNLSWILYGLLFLLNPVWPESWGNVCPEARRKGVRIGAAIALLLGLITRFGI